MSSRQGKHHRELHKSPTGSGWAVIVSGVGLREVLALFQLLGEVDLRAENLELVKLCFQPVNVGFLVLEDSFEEVAGAVVAEVGGLADGVVIGLYGVVFGGAVVLQLCGNIDRKSVV